MRCYKKQSGIRVMRPLSRSDWDKSRSIVVARFAINPSYRKWWVIQHSHTHNIQLIGEMHKATSALSHKSTCDRAALGRRCEKITVFAREGRGIESPECGPITILGDPLLGAFHPNHFQKNDEHCRSINNGSEWRKNLTGHWWYRFPDQHWSLKVWKACKWMV